MEGSLKKVEIKLEGRGMQVVKEGGFTCKLT